MLSGVLLILIALILIKGTFSVPVALASLHRLAFSPIIILSNKDENIFHYPYSLNTWYKESRHMYIVPQ